MNIRLKVNPLSINGAWRGGRRFRTRDYDLFERQICLLIPRGEMEGKAEIFVHYVFHLKNFSRADVFNFEKCLSDTLVKHGHMLDDRYIRAGYVRKEKVETEEEEYIEVKIVPYTGQDIEILE